MQTLLTVWRFLLLAAILVFPQLLGVLLYYRLRRAPRWLAFIAAALVPAIVFIFLSPIYFFAGVREAYARGEGCGMPAMAATILVFAGTIMELGGGLFAQIVLAKRRRRQVVASKGEK
ncbi:MAG TPA: hypothetical protein VJR02_04765 [Pyrinomonadaceae bacterium]|nr:hypothetical protein [Pyrinomonadaceae bacterium]